MKIMFAATECAPFVKTGGLGDVVGALPKSLAKAGNKVAVVIPYFESIAQKYKKEAEFLFDYTVQVGWRNQYCGVKYLHLNGVDYYFIDNERYFKREGLYGYYDDGERFSFFQLAVIELMQKIDFIPDILNLNDYHTAFIPFLLREKYGWINAFKKISTVLTIHNLEFQGQYGRDILMDFFNMTAEKYDDGTIRMGQAVNFMKAGIFYADRVNTVSPTYAKEITTKEFGCGLDGILRMIGPKLSGILNGIDYEINNPKNDKRISANFSKENLKGKVRDKEKLQEIFGLPKIKNIPLIAVVSRLTYQKGFQLLVSEMENLMKFNVQFVLLGTGYKDLEDSFKYFAKKYPKKCSVSISFDVDLAQKIYAGADIFLMPSAFEPCGLSQMISMRYGTLPVVHQIGGLVDSVEAYNPIYKTGTGFGFKEFSSFYLMESIKEAIKVYHDDKETWHNLIKYAMEKDFSWDKASKNYQKIYTEILR